MFFLRQDAPSCDYWRLATHDSPCLIKNCKAVLSHAKLQKTNNGDRWGDTEMGSFIGGIIKQKQTHKHTHPIPLQRTAGSEFSMESNLSI